MPKMTGARFLAEALQAYGVTSVFFIPGIVKKALFEMDERTQIQRVLTHGEKSAAYMADGYARVTGRPGVCEGPSGGGATYILPGVVEANESSFPILAITSDVATSSRGRYPLTELDQPALFGPLTK